MKLEQLIKKSLLTEKSHSEMTKNVYTFSVDLDSTKEQIKKAVETCFNVEVMSVNTSVQRGHTYRKSRSKETPTPVTILAPSIKKAFVRLKPNFSLSIIPKSES